MFSPRENVLAARTAGAEARAEGDPEGDADASKDQPYKAKTCTDCNRQFCMALDLPICKGATDEDVTTSCFRKELPVPTQRLRSIEREMLTWFRGGIERDSSKDEAVVFIFIIATVGLLGWALVRPFVRRWMEVRLFSPYSLPNVSYWKETDWSDNSKRKSEGHTSLLRTSKISLRFRLMPRSLATVSFLLLALHGVQGGIFGQQNTQFSVGYSFASFIALDGVNT